jgi:hypothetical protein
MAQILLKHLLYQTDLRISKICLLLFLELSVYVVQAKKSF